MLCIQQLIAKHFQDVVKTVRILHPGDRGRLHVGKFQCGEYSLITKYLLEGYGYQPQVWQNQQGYGDYSTDHTFLVVDDCYIDLAYRHLLETDCSQSDDCPYRRYLFNHLADYFIGTEDQLNEMCNTLDKIHQKHYGDVIDTEFKMDWIRKRWSKQSRGDPYRFDMDRVILKEPLCLEVKIEIDKIIGN